MSFHKEPFDINHKPPNTRSCYSNTSFALAVKPTEYKLNKYKSTMFTDAQTTAK